jgi:cytoskeletal protein RodZ
VLRLREDVLIAFEEGDFESMPKSGYAQGMLSSYARYLGLNPRQVTNQFSADLADWEHGGSGRSMAGRGGSRRRRRDDPSYETPSNGRYEGSRGLLPTSGGYAGDVYGYATTSQAHSRGQRPSPLVNQSRSLPDEGSRGGDRAGEGHRYSSRDLSTYSSGRDGQRTMRYRAQADRSGYASRYRGSEGIADRSARDRVSVRRVAPSDYTDDLQYGDALPYEAASTRSGRRSSRNIAHVDRPNVQRRTPGRDSRGASRGRASEPRRGGVAGVIEAFFSDPRRTLALVLVVAAVVLTIVIISSVGACVNKNISSDRTVSVTTSASEGGDSSKSESSTTTKTQETEKAAADAAAAKKTKEDAAAKTETKVEVSVDDGEVSWVEIENDGKSVVAEQITGPWSQSFTVTSKFTIQVSDTAAVTVTKNGETQKFESKTSGIGTITIEGTKATTTSTNGSNNSSTTTNGSTTSTTGTTNGTGSTTTTQSDESASTSTSTQTDASSTTSSSTTASTSTSGSSRTAPSTSTASYSYFSKGA